MKQAALVAIVVGAGLVVYGASACIERLCEPAPRAEMAVGVAALVFGGLQKTKRV